MATVKIPGDEMVVPKADMKFETPRLDVPNQWPGWHLWNLAKQESPERDPLFFALCTFFLMCYFGMLHVVFHEIFIRKNERYRAMKQTE